MPFSSPYPDLTIPKTDVISYLFPAGHVPPDNPVWIDSESNQSLSPRQLLQWVKRLAIGLDRLQVQPGEAVLIFTPNHIFVPVAYLGIVGSRRIFSASSPGFKALGK
jgi:4-coumarate--CoA ligase